LNFGLSPDFSVQLKVSLSERLSEGLSQKLKSPTALSADDMLKPMTITTLHWPWSIIAAGHHHQHSWWEQ